MRKLFTLSLLHLAMTLLIFCLSVSSVYAVNTSNYFLPYDVDANTIALYHFDSNATDAVGNHDGTLFGDAGYAAGYFSDGLSLDGIGDYARMGNIHKSPVVSGANGSVEMWIKLDSASGNFVFSGAGNEYGGYWDEGWYLGTYSSSTLRFMLWSGTWNIADSHVDASSLVGSWHHVLGTWGSRGLEIWIDGVLKGTNPYTGGLPNPDYKTVLVGTDSWTWETDGKIDEVRISSIQRTPTVPEPSSIITLSLPVLMLGIRQFKLRRK